MQPSPSDDQAALRESVRRYCQKSYSFAETGQIIASAGGARSRHWAEFARLGWLAASLPEDVGGAGDSPMDTAIILEEFGRALVLDPFLSCIALASQTVAAACGAAQARSILEPVIGGEKTVALAHFEPESRGNALFVESSATPAKKLGGYILSGRKSAVMDAPGADSYIVSARTGGLPGDRDGISLFHVPRGAPGLRIRGYRTMDSRFSADLLMEQVEITPDALLGEEGSSAAAIEHGVQHAIAAMCAEAVGAMEATIDQTIAYLKQRQAYGAKLCSYQALQHKIADMIVELEMCKSILLPAFGSLETDDSRARAEATSAAKVLIDISGRFIGANAIQLHGGIGIADACLVGHYFKRLTAIATHFGSTGFHLRQYSRVH